MSACEHNPYRSRGTRLVIGFVLGVTVASGLFWTLAQVQREPRVKVVSEMACAFTPRGSTQGPRPVSDTGLAVLCWSRP